MDDLLLLPVILIIWFVQWLADRKLRKKPSAQKPKFVRTVSRPESFVPPRNKAASPAPKSIPGEDPFMEFFKSIQSNLVPELQTEELFEKEEQEKELKILEDEKRERTEDIVFSDREQPQASVEPQIIHVHDHYSIISRKSRKQLNLSKNALINSVIFSIILSPPKACRSIRTGPVRPL